MSKEAKHDHSMDANFSCMILSIREIVKKGGLIMDKDSLTIEQFSELLKGWNIHPVKITKYEMKDHDETLLELTDITFQKNRNRVDDYEPKYTLHLQGDGKVKTELDRYEEMPTSQYEIPLDDDTEYKFDGARFSLKTDRGIYTIEKMAPTE